MKNFFICLFILWCSTLLVAQGHGGGDCPCPVPWGMQTHCSNQFGCDTTMTDYHNSDSDTGSCIIAAPSGDVFNCCGINYM